MNIKIDGSDIKLQNYIYREKHLLLQNLQANALLTHSNGISSVLLFTVFYIEGEIKSPKIKLGFFLRKDGGWNALCQLSLRGLSVLSPFMLLKLAYPKGN